MSLLINFVAIGVILSLSDSFGISVFKRFCYDLIGNILKHTILGLQSFLLIKMSFSYCFSFQLSCHMVNGEHFIFTNHLNYFACNSTVVTGTNSLSNHAYIFWK